jgi:hypothetical protein
MASFPGKSDLRAAPYQRVYTSFAAAVNLTAEVEQARCATSGFVVIVGTTGTFVWKDSAGTTQTTTLPVGTFNLPFGATSIEISTMVGTVIAYWHPSNAR